MIKAIEYAYATSTIADEMRAPDGCYFISIKRDVTEWRDVERKGPFASIDEAERAALTIPLPWSRFTKRAA